LPKKNFSFPVAVNNSINSNNKNNNIHLLQLNRYPLAVVKVRSFGFLVINVCIYGEHYNNILLTAIGLSPGGSGYFTCTQNMKLVTTKFKSGGLHEKHVVATWNLGNHLSICF